MASRTFFFRAATPSSAPPCALTPPTNSTVPNTQTDKTHQPSRSQPNSTCTNPPPHTPHTSNKDTAKKRKQKEDDPCRDDSEDEEWEKNRPLMTDGWLSAFQGRQVADGGSVGSSTGWKKVRNQKWAAQFGGGSGIADKPSTTTSSDKSESCTARTTKTAVTISNTTSLLPPSSSSTSSTIFSGVVVYINGSTYPIISDYKLKRLLGSAGATVCVSLTRRAVTHVIIGPPSHPTTSNSSCITSTPIPTATTTSTPGIGTTQQSLQPPPRRHGPCGGGLSATKIQKEALVRRPTAGLSKGGRIKYVTAEWVLASVRAGKRLPEREFAGLKDVADRMGGVGRWVSKR